MGLYSIIPGFCGAPWAVGAPRIVTTFHPTSNGPAWSTKPVLSRWGIFVAIDNNTLYGSKLSIFLLCQKSLGY